MPMFYTDWIDKRRSETKKQDIKVEYYKSTFENKEVCLHAEGSTIYVDWYEDGELVKEPKFPVQYETEIKNRAQKYTGRYICRELMTDLLGIFSSYLPYLETKDKVNLHYITLEGKLAL